MKFFWLLGISFTLAACLPLPTAMPAAGANKLAASLHFERTVVSLTFDDGDADNYSIRDVLRDNELHATFYVVSGFTDTPGYMTADELKALYADGNEIGGHTLSHGDLTKLSQDEMRREICEDRAALQAHGFEAVSFAYPYGHYNPLAMRMVKDCGYNSARRVTAGPESIPPASPYEITAMPYIVQDTRLPKMTRYVTQVEQGGGGWAVFVFHHVCDTCDVYAVSPEIFSQFAQWLGEQQKNGLMVKTVGETLRGEASFLPSAQP